MSEYSELNQDQLVKIANAAKELAKQPIETLMLLLLAEITYHNDSIPLGQKLTLKAAVDIKLGRFEQETMIRK